MILEIDPEVLEDSESFILLNRLMYLVLDGQHLLRVKDENIEKSKWFVGLGHEKKSFQDIIRRSWSLSLNNGPYERVRIRLSPDNEDGTELSPATAYKYLNPPLYILVENGESDGTFIELILAKFGKGLKHALANGKIIIEGSGGKDEIIKLCERKISGKHARLVVIIDSDALFPGDIKENTKRITEKMKEYNVPCFVTVKRESENYIPISALKKWAVKPAYIAKVNAFESLTAIQKDHLDMKYGFKYGLPVEQTEIYGEYPAADFATGFGAKVWKAYEVAFESISSKDFDTKSSNEFNGIVKGIFSRV